jgi:AhpD family alkylhydroperoxidase
MNLRRVDPAAYQAMGALETYGKAAGLNPVLRNLLKIRASQINGCAYCVDLHIREALEAGENPRRLHTVVVWKESPFFTEEEKALLALTEEVTLIQGRVSDRTWAEALEFWDEKTLAAILMAIITINAWNRIGVATEMAPERGPS